MSFADTIAYQAFWSQSWSAPLRALCRWPQGQAGPVVAPLPDALAPGWLRPLWFQRQVVAAVQARLAWRAAHPEAPPYWYEDTSRPLWDRRAWTPYPPRWLRTSSDHVLLTGFYSDLERLARLLETAPDESGVALWTHAVLGCCERLAQFYQELLRFLGRRAARRFVRRLLNYYASQASSPVLPEEVEDDEPESDTASERAEIDSACWPCSEAWRAWLAARGAAPPVPETLAR